MLKGKWKSFLVGLLSIGIICAVCIPSLRLRCSFGLCHIEKTAYCVSGRRHTRVGDLLPITSFAVKEIEKLDCKGRKCYVSVAKNTGYGAQLYRYQQEITPKM